MLRIALACALTTVGLALTLTAPTAFADPADCPLDPSGQCIPGPPAEPAPPPPPQRPVRVALCDDGSIAFTQHSNYEGTCAKHGGAVKWLAGN